MPQLVGLALGPLCKRLLQNHRLSVMLQKKNNQAVIVHHRQLTMSVWLMVMMLVCKARKS
jgi:hypothetical protein